ncbi:ABC transporter G family member 23 [Drosophila nasuta]|uniref:ABC transporter G family member 23 n=1 Tax=Drosophila albomicans TaxID=7291 RepID=A0A6P8XCY8_DROAB|nr:ABC transporter G family member 23 [Drosophila albomicans]XP_034097637.2 ABC transporter G family member 23 [Drosophila albomicans]XP_060665522.1 ABC transporter G family member 23 [Drosophila nasuta]XP_060665528.1 ABC transporter G family member 23 [Drosophila nasuta]
MAAVEVRNGYKYYGSKSNPKIVLNQLNMNVMRGSIYGLLGASGCGKTTLLSCIVGQRRLNGGEVSVLGVKPGEPGSGVPGSRVGFMPQEIALVEEMTVKETIFYFGRIYGLTDEKIREKYKLLKELLQLPPPRQMIKECSGGQQRRLSFACAMIHDPELLILDEPTVGLDPMLREKIWDFLVETTRNSKLAVIITTHYIEEAKQANCIGLMRNGVLLAEDTPTNIMIKFGTQSIEDAFLILSQRQGNEDELPQLMDINRNQAVPTAMLPTEVIDSHEPTAAEKSPIPFEEPMNENRKKVFFTTKGRIKALMTKNFVQLFRQPSGIIFMLLFPIIQLTCFYLAIGKTPRNLGLGVYSGEVDSYAECFDDNLRTLYQANDTCHFNKLSCRYIRELGDDIAIRKYYDTEDAALADAKRTVTVGYIHFAKNFSESVSELIEDGIHASDGSVDNAELTVHIDMTDQQVAYFMQRKLRDKFSSFMNKVVEECNVSAALVRLPVQFQDPIYGSTEIEFQQYCAPGVVMTMVFFLATLMTAAVFISERMDGIWDRTLLAGVSATEMLWAHLLTQLIIMSLQSFEVIMYIGLVFDTYNNGDTTTLIGLLTLTAFCGMLFGLFISVFCKSHTEANFVATGAFYPMIILCGLLWPLESMPGFLQDLVMVLPFTIPSISARNVIEKGWSITNEKVYNGFLVMSAWTIIFFVLCLIGIRRKS